MTVGWQILDAYFEETRYPRARTALEGYDEFIRRGLGRVLRNMNPIVVLRTDSQEKVSVFVGGRNGDAYQFSHPKLDTGQEMLPDHARQHDLSYSATLLADVVIAEGDNDTILKGVILGEVPIMLHSCICRLHGLVDDQLAALGECPYDEGGYFVVDGNERYLAAKERGATDRLFVYETLTDPTHDWICELGALNISRVRGTGELQALGLPLFVLFRLVGLETDMGIINAIRRNVGDVIHPDALDASLRPSVLQASVVGYTFASAFTFAVQSLRLRKAELVRHVRSHLAVADKADHLAEAAARLLRTIHGVDPVLDRDSGVNRRVDTCGVKFATMFSAQYVELRAQVEAGALEKVAELMTSKVITEGMRREIGSGYELARGNMHGSMSCLSAVESTAPSTHGSQWGVICPVDARLGVSKQLAVLARVTATGLCTASVKAALIATGVGPGATDTPVELNGVRVGTVADPGAFVVAFRALRRGGHLHGDVSVSWRPGSARVEVASDAGRLSRPLLIAGRQPPPDFQSWAELLPPPQVGTYVPPQGETVQEDAVIEFVDCAEADDAYVAMSPQAVTERHTHCEIHPSTIMATKPLLIPFSHHNPAASNVAACEHVQECVSLLSGQRPLVTTRWESYLKVQPYGCNAIVAVAAFSGWNQKAAVIMNASSVERGFCQTSCFRTLVFDEGCNGHFCNPTGRLVDLREDATYDLLAIDGMPVVGSRLDPGAAVLGRVVQLRSPGGVSEQDASYIADATMAGVVDRVTVYPNPSGPGRRVKVRVRQDREPVVGDSFATRLGQKVVVARMVRQEDMPFLSDGTVPDVLLNPSQMTVAGLLEALGAKAACCDGAFVDATSLTGERVEVAFGHRLEAAGRDSRGAEVVYDPVGGSQLPNAITMCPVYCMRLDDMVVDKLAATRVGEMGSINRQPVMGARIGELESDALLAVGAASFLKESMVERSDVMVASFVEGECVAKHAEFGTVCLPHDVHSPVTAVHKVPRALTLLQQELACMGVRMAVMRHEDDPQYGDSAE